MTASIGVALSFAAHERPENVLGRALTAGNRARDRGGACIEISEEQPSPTVSDDEFTSALARGELLLHYLPIVSCATGRVAGLESLIRWDHPDRGLLLPSEFLPDAERTGAIVDIGTWALEQACLQMAQWHRGAGESLKLDVNVSAREFAEPAFPAQVQRIISRVGARAGRGVARSHRGDARREPRRVRSRAAAAARDRRPSGRRRLRHRRLVARVAEAVPVRRDQDRPRLRRRPRAPTARATRSAARSSSSRTHSGCARSRKAWRRWSSTPRCARSGASSGRATSSGPPVLPPTTARSRPRPSASSTHPTRAERRPLRQWRQSGEASPRGRREHVGDQIGEGRWFGRVLEPVEPAIRLGGTTVEAVGDARVGEGVGDLVHLAREPPRFPRAAARAGLGARRPGRVGRRPTRPAARRRRLRPGRASGSRAGARSCPWCTRRNRPSAPTPRRARPGARSRRAACR